MKKNEGIASPAEKDLYKALDLWMDGFAKVIQSLGIIKSRNLSDTTVNQAYKTLKSVEENISEVLGSLQSAVDENNKEESSMTSRIGQLLEKIESLDEGVSYEKQVEAAKQKIKEISKRIDMVRSTMSKVKDPAMKKRKEARIKKLEASKSEYMKKISSAKAKAAKQKK